MQQKEIEEIIRHFFIQLQQILSRIEKKIGREDLHNFRVEIKKLRAFLRLLNLELKEQRNQKIPHQLKKIYSLAGKIREVQLHLRKINKHYKDEKKPQQYIDLLENEKAKWKIKLQTVLKDLQLPKEEEELKRKMPIEIRQETVTNFFQQKISSIHSLLSAKRINDEGLHSIRKYLKDIIYVTQILEDAETPMGNLLWTENEIKNAEEIAHELGLINDVRISLSFGKQAYLNKINVEERNGVGQTITQWKKEKTEMKKNIIGKLRNSQFN